MTSVLVVGCGYLGRRVAQRWVERGHDVYVTTRSQSNRADEFVESGFKPILLDVTDSAQTWELPRVDTVLFAVGYDPFEQVLLVFPFGGVV